MLLAIDAGNSNTCFALFKEIELVHFWRTETHRSSAELQWKTSLDTILTQNSLTLTDIDTIILCCVVSSRLGALKRFCATVPAQVFIMGDPSLPLPCQALIDVPEEVGLDLMANAWGAHQLYGGPLLVVDLGTATTLSLIDEAGNFRGTVIAPGVQTSLKALHQAAPRLPEVSVMKSNHLLGTNTLDSLQSGIFWGNVSLLEGLIDRILKENFQGLINKSFKVVATGGLSPLLASQIARINFIDPTLTVKGLAHIVHYIHQKEF